MAARAAVSSQLLDISIEGAKGVLFNISGGPDLTMAEVDEAARIISEHCDADANIIFGASIDQRLSDQVRITVIATGFDETRARLVHMAQPPQPPITQVAPQTTEQIQGVEGVVSEPVSTEETPIDDNDEFGERFEIPPFLRGR